MIDGPTEAREVVESETRAAASRPYEGERVDELAADDALWAELKAFLEAGLLEKKLGGDRDALAGFLIDNYLALEDPWSALDVLRVHCPYPDQWGQVGSQLVALGDRALGAEAMLTALRANPVDPSWAYSLLEVDPAGALAVIEGALAQDPSLAEQGLRGTRIQLLLAAGRTDDALAEIDQLLAAEFVDPGVFDLLGQLPPEEREARLRQLVENDEVGTARLRLAELLIEQESEEEGARADPLDPRPEPGQLGGAQHARLPGPRRRHRVVAGTRGRVPGVARSARRIGGSGSRPAGASTRP